MILIVASFLYLVLLLPLFLIFNVNETIIYPLLLQFFAVLAANILNILYVEKRLTFVSPFLILSGLYLLAYHFSTIYFIFFPEHFSENIDFRFDDYDLVKSCLMITNVSFLSIAAGYFIACASLPKLKTEYVIKKLDFRFSYFFFFCWLILVSVKFVYLKLGWYGSLAAFNGSVQTAGLFALIIPFFLYVYPYIAYLAVVACRDKSTLKFMVMVIVVELLVAVIAGNRRDLITLLFPVFIVYYSFGMLRLSFLRAFGVAIFLVCYLVFVNIYGRILGNVGGESVDYFYLFSNAYTFISIYFIETINFVFAEIFSWIGQLYLIGTVVSVNTEGYGLLSPLNDLLSRFIAFDTNLPDVEYEIFVQTLFIKGEKPYLTNPAAAYLYYLTGLSGVALYGFLVGFLFRCLFVIGLKYKYSALLILGFSFLICSFPLQSLVGSFVGISKVSLFAIFLFVFIKVFLNAKKYFNFHPSL